MKRRLLAVGLGLFLSLAGSDTLRAANSFELPPPTTYTLSLQYLALTSNAGGQIAYGVRFAKDDTWELGAFANQYLLTGTMPLSGAVYSRRFAVCEFPCVVRSFFQIGAGLSTAGPMVELMWTLNPMWIVRIDIATHAYFSTIRPIIWSYPLWFGLSVPF